MWRVWLLVNSTSWKLYPSCRLSERREKISNGKFFPIFPFIQSCIVLKNNTDHIILCSVDKTEMLTLNPRNSNIDFLWRRKNNWDNWDASISWEGSHATCTHSIDSELAFPKTVNRYPSTNSLRKAFEEQNCSQKPKKIIIRRPAVPSVYYLMIKCCHDCTDISMQFFFILFETT